MQEHALTCIHTCISKHSYRGWKNGTFLFADQSRSLQNMLASAWVRHLYCCCLKNYSVYTVLPWQCWIIAFIAGFKSFILLAIQSGRSYKKLHETATWQAISPIVGSSMANKKRSISASSYHNSFLFVIIVNGIFYAPVACSATLRLELQYFKRQTLFVREMEINSRQRKQISLNNF